MPADWQSLAGVNDRVAADAAPQYAVVKVVVTTYSCENHNTLTNKEIAIHCVPHGYGGGGGEGGGRRVQIPCTANTTS